MARLEDRICREAAGVFVISDEEGRALEAVTANPHYAVATNGVDLDLFEADDGSFAEPRTCCFVGVLDYQPNVDAIKWFVSTVWPKVRDQFPTSELKIIGRNPVGSVRRLVSRNGIRLYADVPDVRPYINQSQVVLAPLSIARGVQNKVLEAMALGRPVVASTAALSGLSAKPGQDALEANSPDEWAIAISTLFENGSLRSRIGKSGRQYVERRHCWDSTLKPFAEALELTTGRARSKGLTVV